MQTAMTNKLVKTPDPDHPITIQAHASRVVVSFAGRIVADTRKALMLREASYAPVLYIPLQDVDSTLLERSEQSTYCPYKGDCSYYSIAVGEGRSTNAVWTYAHPYASVKEIAGHVAFYRDRVDSIEERT
jgi:uncharacterized protein (DUF427 family)